MIAVAKNEDFQGNPQLKAIKCLMEKAEKGQAFLVFPTLILTELLDQSSELLEKLSNGTHGEMIDLTPAIAKMAARIRKRYTRTNTGKSKIFLSTPDCIYAATAIILKCDHLITTDGIGNNKISLISFKDDLLRDHQLSVCYPSDLVDQHQLDL